MISLTINGQIVEAKEGMTVLEAAQVAGIYIPSLCADPDLEPYGACRLCVVEIDGMNGLPTSCTTLVSEGMVVRTDTSAVDSVRRTVVELLIADHPSDCLTCPSNQRCELQKIAAYLGITERRFERVEQLQPVDTSNPFFDHDPNYCILCGKCVRICNEVQGVGAIDLAFRGYETQVCPGDNKSLIESNCESDGECVVHCPVGALAMKNSVPPMREVATTCVYCGVGCQIYLGIRDGRVTSVRGRRDEKINNASLCVKGRFGIAEFVHHPERLTTPLIKRDEKLVEASWDEALELVASKLSGYGKGEVAVVSSAKCTNEDNYVIQKFARAVLGTNNVDHCARLCHAPSVAGLVNCFGSGAMSNSINEISDAACILAIGTNTTEAHPVIGLRVKKAVWNGAKLIVANPREIELVRFADIWLNHNPGSDVALLMGMMRVIVDEGLLDLPFIENRCENFAEFKDSLDNFGLDFVETITGVSGDKIVKAARMYATNNPASLLYAMGITQHSHGTDNVIATANLAMLTGNMGIPSGGVNPLRGQNNVQGACDMGALPNVYPGYQSVAVPEIQRKFEAAWDCSLSDEPGLPMTEVIPLADKGEIKAVYLIGENPLLSEPDAGHAREALKKLDFFVVQDIFLSETAELADVVLPGTSFAEKDGTFTNTERRVQRVRKAMEPIGDSRPDWLITCRIAREMGSSGFDFTHPSQIMDEIADLTPSYGGITFERLEDGGLQWPCPTKDHLGTPILHVEQFSRGKGRFFPLSYKPPVELPDDEYPLMLTTGRNLYHFHTGTLTRKVAGLNILKGEGSVEINPDDALALNISNGEMIKIISRRGDIKSKVQVTGVSSSGVVYMNFHFAESAANVLTNAALDPVSKIPEYKVCAVKIEKIVES
ncbi:formate dehydrogenase subunit alpha [Chloroflexota bacterium]